MTQINKIEFRTVVIDGTNCELNILTYSKENLSIYFSIQSIAQCINEFLDIFSAREIFHTDFYNEWINLDLKRVTEFEIRLLIPINLLLEPSSEFSNPMPVELSNMRYLNDKYKNTISEYWDHTVISNDIFCIAEKQEFTIDTSYKHVFVNSIAFLSFIPMLRMNFIRKLYKTFFLTDLLYYKDIESIYENLVLNRARMQESLIVNVFQLDMNEIRFIPLDLTTEHKELFVMRFNKACRIFKTFAFNIMDEQATYISKHLNIVTRFGLDLNSVSEIFNNIPRMIVPPGQQRLTEEQRQLLCKEPSTDRLAGLNATELNILHSLIKIHLMIQRMTGVRIHKDDLKFYRRVLKEKYSTDLEELIFENFTITNRNNNNTSSSNNNGDSEEDDDDEIFKSTLAFDTINGKQQLVKNYTIGEIINEFLKLYLYAQENVNTLWLCKFIRMSCNPRYSNLVNIMADFVPFFQRFFTNDFNINSINNLIIFLQGMCQPDINKLKSMKDERNLRQLDVRNFKTFSITKYKSFNTNPLITFIDMLLSSSSRHPQTKNCIVNMKMLSETEQYNLTYLVNPREREFIDYIYDLTVTDSGKKFDLSGDERFNLQNLNYDNIVPIVSTNTFNENNTTYESIKLFNGVMHQTMFFHELTNRIIYKVPNIICNIIVK